MGKMMRVLRPLERLEQARMGVKNLIAARCVYYRTELAGGFFRITPGDACS